MMWFRRGSRAKSRDIHRGSPRRRRCAGGRISISGKLFIYLGIFTVFILGVVWLMQIGLLNYFYSQSRYKEITVADRTVTEALEGDPASLEKVVETVSADYLLCVRVFRVEGSTALQIAGAEVSGDCLIHHMSGELLSAFHNKALENGGVYTRRLSPRALFYAQPELMADWEDLPQENKQNFRDFFRGQSGAGDMNMINVRVTTGARGEQYIILLDAGMEPLGTTVDTLKTQFWTIAFVLLWGALVMALLIARRISEPLKKMNRAAGRLARGQYDADFSADGYREITELSESLTHASAQLAQNDTLQKELIANISHDLRTPLTMIKGYGEVMRDLPGENTPENVQVIIDETQRLSELVNDLLDLSKLQAGTYLLNPETFNLTELIEATLLRYEKLTERDGYRIEYKAEKPVTVRADRTMILQVIYNLINNAINYTGESKLVRVTQTLSQDGSRVRVSVTDSGEGIAPAQIPLIWDRYYKVDKVHRRAMIGTGLGLSIVKQVLEAHHTTYGVESKLGEGSTFWFELRVEETHDDESTLSLSLPEGTEKV